MGNALQAVLQLKEQEQQAEQFRSQQITQAAEIFQRAIAQRQQNNLENLRLNQNQKQFDVSKDIQKKQFDINSGQDAQRIDIAKQGNILQKRGQDIDLSRLGLKDNNGVISENPDSNIQKNILSEIQNRKSQELIANVVKGQAMISNGASIQKAAYDAEDDKLYAEGQQAIDMGRNIIKATITPPSQTVAGYLDPQTAKITPFIPTTPEVSKPEQTKTISQIKAEKEKKKQELELSGKKSEQEQTIALEDKKPLSAEGATRYSGAKQGIDNINNIIGQINSYRGNRRDLIYQANLAIEAENAKDTIMPMAKGIYRSSKLSRIGDDAKALANNFSTLAENLLRARTGATAPDPEIVRENARTLLKTFQESPETWNQKLKNDFDFLKTTHDEIRPLRKDEAKLNGEIYKEYKSLQEAEKANLPKGTIIIINGRKAEVY